MDYILFVVATILIILLIVCHLLNRVQKTSDIAKLLESIVRAKPLTKAFSLGQTVSDSTFTNVSVDANGKPVVSEDRYPLDLNARPIILSSHGDIVEGPNGFTVTGMEPVHFKCPEGYEGEICTMKPLCDPQDAGKIKSLSFTQFNALQLYRNEFTHSQIKLFRDEISNPRLRIHCLNSHGNYEIEACPQNTLLDKNLNCQPYDICSDNLNGYKHNLPISANDPPLQSNEYYICEHNRSVKTKCSDNSVFSLSAKGCITKSPCYNKDRATIAIDDKSYIQCQNDSGTIINCDNHVIDTNGILSCYTPICQPITQTYEDKHLKYVFGEVTCVNDVATSVSCDNSVSDRIYKYTWADDFQFHLPNWPKQVLVNGECVAPNDDIITNPIVDLAWSLAMPNVHPFDLKRQEYVCTNATEYRWDYIEQVVIPEPTNGDERLIYSGAPCQNSYPMTFKYKVNNYPDNKIYIIKTQPVHLQTYTNVFMWPVYNNIDKQYKQTTCAFTNKGLSVTTFSTTLVPLGFYLDVNAKANDDGDTQLTLLGYDNFQPLDNVQYYFIASGKIDLAQLYEPKEIQSTLVPSLENNLLTTTESKTFAIEKFTKRVEIVDSRNRKLVMRPKPYTLTYRGNVYDLGFSVFSLESDSSTNSATLVFDRIRVKFSTTDYPTIQF